MGEMSFLIRIRERAMRLVINLYNFFQGGGKTIRFTKSCNNPLRSQQHNKLVKREPLRLLSTGHEMQRNRTQSWKPLVGRQ